jgi:hypothetical protein
MKKEGYRNTQILNFASVVFLAVFFATLFSGLYNRAEGKGDLTYMLTGFSIIFLVISISTYFRPLPSLIVGMILYIILVSWLGIAINDILFDSKGAMKLFGLLIVGLVIILKALFDEIKRRKNRF